MGGLGSGNWYRSNKKTTVEDSLKLSLSKSGLLDRLKELIPQGWTAGGIRWYRTYDGKTTAGIGYELERKNDIAILTLIYTHNPKFNPEQLKYSIQLITTLPNYGGLRWWFLCPGQSCGRRVGVLYNPPGGKYFLCRHCYDLTYQSCQESHRFDRLFAQVAANVGVSPEMVKKLLK